MSIFHSDVLHKIDLTRFHFSIFFSSLSRAKSSSLVFFDIWINICIKGVGEMAQQFKAWVFLPEDLGSVPSTCMVANNHLQLQF